MKRVDLIRRVRAIARSQGRTFTLKCQGSKHEIWTLDGEQDIVIPRHREINERTARSIIERIERP